MGCLCQMIRQQTRSSQLLQPLGWVFVDWEQFGLTNKVKRKVLSFALDCLMIAPTVREEAIAVMLLQVLRQCSPADISSSLLGCLTLAHHK